MNKKCRALAVFLGLAAGCSSRPVNPPAELPPPATARSPMTAPVGEWVELFDGKTLNGWRVLKEKAYSDGGEVRVEDGAIVLNRGSLQTGIAWDGEFPRDSYEVSVEARRVSGHDFFCGMTFPVGTEPCTLIVGGWGGNVVGLSNVDGQHAAENVTTTGASFEDGRWYAIRLRVTPERIEVWIDDERLINLPRENHRFEVWWEQEPVQPFGVGTWDTGGALRNIRTRRIDPSAAKVSGETGSE